MIKHLDKYYDRWGNEPQIDATSVLGVYTVMLTPEQFKKRKNFVEEIIIEEPSIVYTVERTAELNWLLSPVKRS